MKTAPLERDWTHGMILVNERVGPRHFYRSAGADGRLRPDRGDGVGSLLHHEKWAKPWMPNIVVGALTIGLTATIVEALLARAQRRADSDRVQPVLDVALPAIGEALYYFLRSAASSYASSNLKSFRSALPRDLEGWLALLIDELPNADEPNPLVRPGLSPVLLASGLMDSLDAVAARDSDVLLQERPTLLAAMNAFHRDLHLIMLMDQQARLNVISPADQEVYEAMSRALREVRDFAEVYATAGRPIPPELIEDLNIAARKYHADRLQALDPERER